MVSEKKDILSLNKDYQEEDLMWLIKIRIKL